MGLIKKSVSAIVCFSVLATLFVGCGKNNPNESNTNDANSSSISSLEYASLSTEHETSSVALSSSGKSNLAETSSSAASKSVGTAKPSSATPKSSSSSKSATTTSASKMSVSMDGLYALHATQWYNQYGISYHRITDEVQKVQKIEFLSATVNGLSCTIDKCSTESQLIAYVKELVDENVENPTGDYLADYTNYTMPEEDNVGKPIGLVMMYFDKEKAEQKATEFFEDYGERYPYYYFIITIKVTMMDGTVGNFKHTFKWPPAFLGSYFNLR